MNENEVHRLGFERESSRVTHPYVVPPRNGIDVKRYAFPVQSPRHIDKSAASGHGVEDGTPYLRVMPQTLLADTATTVATKMRIPIAVAQTGLQSGVIPTLRGCPRFLGHSVSSFMPTEHVQIPR
jgi:hypothetical protein